MGPAPEALIKYRQALSDGRGDACFGDAERGATVAHCFLLACFAAASWAFSSFCCAFQFASSACRASIFALSCPSLYSICFTVIEHSFKK